MPHYDMRMRPPAAVIEIQVIDLVSGTAEHVPAKLDTGAAISVLPRTTVETLQLIQRSEAAFYGHDGVLTMRPTYYVGIEVAGYRIPVVEVASSRRTDILLGRDVLNRFIVTFNGKDIAFEMRDP